jgi:hypothetical protein
MAQWLERRCKDQGTYLLNFVSVNINLELSSAIKLIKLRWEKSVQLDSTREVQLIYDLFALLVSTTPQVNVCNVGFTSTFMSTNFSKYGS